MQYNNILLCLVLLMSLLLSVGAVAQCGHIANGNMEQEQGGQPDQWTAMTDGGYVNLYDPETKLGGSYSEDGGLVVALYVDSSSDQAEIFTTISGLSIGSSYTIEWYENVISGYAGHGAYTITVGKQQFYYGNLASYAWTSRKIHFTAERTTEQLSFRLEGTMAETYLLLDGIDIDCSEELTLPTSQPNSSMFGNMGQAPVGWVPICHSASIGTYDPVAMFGIPYSLDGGTVTAFFVDQEDDYAEIKTIIGSLEPGNTYDLHWLVNAVPGYAKRSNYTVSISDISVNYTITSSYDWEMAMLRFKANSEAATLSFRLNGAKGARFLLVDKLMVVPPAEEEIPIDLLNSTDKIDQ